MRGARRPYVFGALESELMKVETGEELLSRAQQHRRHDEMHFIDHARLEKLPDDRDPSADTHILILSHVSRLPQR